MRFHVLGPLDVRSADNQPVEVTSAKHRALVTLLLLEAGRVVSVDRIVDQLWGDSPPATATATLQSYVSQLRRLLEPRRGPRQTPTLLVTRTPGYALLVDPTDVDAHRLPGIVAEGSRLAQAGRLEQAHSLLEEAIGSWRGPPLADLSDSPHVEAERSRLEQLLLAAREQLAAVRIKQGRPDLAVAELEALTAEHPLRERLWALLMEALWAGGRQADALAAYQRCARFLRDELGIEPTPELVRLHEAVLRQQLPAPSGAAASGAASPAAYGTTLDHGHGGPRHGTKPFVGRPAERDVIRGALANTTRGAGSVIVIEGEAGIGKTRLAEEATAIAEAQGWRSAWARCADDAGAPALWPWTQLLEQLGLGELHPTPGADPDRSRFELFQDVRGRLQEVAARAPLLVVLDDLQAADASSVQLLNLFAGHLEQVRVLVVVTVRSVGETLSESVQECVSGLAREPRTLRLRLTGLGEDAVEELLDLAIGAHDPGLAHRIHSRTEGNPFFVGEFAHLLRAVTGQSSAHVVSPGPQEVTADASGAGVTTGPGAAPDRTPMDRLPLPPSVRDVMERRLESLPASTIAILRLAAVLGQEADLPVLQSASGLPPEQVLGAIEAAIRAGVVTEREPGWEWRFGHALIRETLLAGLTRVEAARLHQQVATAVEARGIRSAMDVGRLAHHYLNAVPLTGTGPAVRYATLAAEEARGRFAHPEAAGHLRTALRLLDLEPADDRLRHSLLVALANDLLRSGQPVEAQASVAEALQLAQRLDDHQLMAEAAAVWGGPTLWNWRPYGVVDRDLVALLESLAEEALDDVPLQARLLGTVGVELAYSEQRERAIDFAERAIELARGLDDPALLGRTLNNVSIAAWGAPDGLERRLAAADETIALAGRGLPARTEFFARLHRGPLRLHLGDREGFEDDLAAATRLGATLAGPEVRPHIIYQEAGLALLVGDWQTAEALAEQAFGLFRRTTLWVAAELCWALHQFTLRRQEGRVGDAVGLLVDMGDVGVPLAQVTAVVAAAEAGDLAEARRLRRRWPEQQPLDWTTDSLVVARAWEALALDGDLVTAYADLLPYRGRQVVVGTATACWGSYDLVLTDVARALGREATAVDHAREALVHAQAVQSDWQVGAATERLSALRTA